jgi:hypothetical protein
MKNKTKIGLGDIKVALRDERFKKSLPENFRDDILKFEKNPGCACNISFYKKIFKEAKDILKEYFPGKDIPDIDKEIIELSKNNFSVINCGVEELESYLKKLGPGRKQIAISRYEDQVTVILNELDLIY